MRFTILIDLIQNAFKLLLGDLFTIAIPNCIINAGIKTIIFARKRHNSFYNSLIKCVNYNDIYSNRRQPDRKLFS